MVGFGQKPTRTTETHDQDRREEPFGRETSLCACAIVAMFAPPRSRLRATAVGIYRSIRLGASFGRARNARVERKRKSEDRQVRKWPERSEGPSTIGSGFRNERAAGFRLKSSSCLKDLRSFAPHATLGSFRRLDLSFALLTRTSCSLLI